MHETLTKIGIFDQSLWVEDGRWVMPPLPWLFFSHWHQRDMVKRVLPNFNFHTIFSIDGYAFWYIADRTIFYKHLERAHADGRLQDVVDVLDTESKTIFAKIQHELDQDDAYITEHIDMIFNLYKDFISSWMFATAFGDQIVPLAKNSGYVATEAELFAKVHPHLRATWIEDEVYAMVAIAEQCIATYPELKKGSIVGIAELVEKDAEIDMLVARYIKNFSWCRVSKWIGESIDRTYAYNRLAEEIKNCIEGNHSKNHRTDAVDRGLDGIVALSVCTAYWRAQCAKIEMKMASRMRPILEDVARANNWDYRQVLLLVPSELVAAIQDPARSISNKEKVLAREKVFFSTASHDGEDVIVTPADPEYISIEKIYQKKHDSTDARALGVLKGIGASPGKVTGRVRVIVSAKDFGTFQQDEILVAAETSPTFVPLMRLSSAILTGKGGITSHAAIVSRELGKPCVIAIKDVTKILKDGDMVEVDALKGVVRLLK
ncbi:MAG: pyruvate, water dikinase [Candidatus Parcubacteria bacterium]|jgi:phosphohistidine swiveling domain-containing protein